MDRKTEAGKEKAEGDEKNRIMKQILDYFSIDGAVGGNQDWFSESSMRDGGCGAVAACESCIYFARQTGKKDLYPYETE